MQIRLLTISNAMFQIVCKTNLCICRENTMLTNCASSGRSRRFDVENFGFRDSESRSDFFFFSFHNAIQLQLHNVQQSKHAM